MQNDNNEAAPAANDNGDPSTDIHLSIVHDNVKQYSTPLQLSEFLLHGVSGANWSTLAQMIELNGVSGKTLAALLPSLLVDDDEEKVDCQHVVGVVKASAVIDAFLEFFHSYLECRTITRSMVKQIVDKLLYGEANHHGDDVLEDGDTDNDDDYGDVEPVPPPHPPIVVEGQNNHRVAGFDLRQKPRAVCNVNDVQLTALRVTGKLVPTKGRQNLLVEVPRYATVQVVSRLILRQLQLPLSFRVDLVHNGQIINNNNRPCQISLSHARRNLNGHLQG